MAEEAHSKDRLNDSIQQQQLVYFLCGTLAFDYLRMIIFRTKPRNLFSNSDIFKPCMPFFMSSVL